jgi:hypothetical protein
VYHCRVSGIYDAAGRGEAAIRRRAATDYGFASSVLRIDVATLISLSIIMKKKQSR